MSNVKVGRNALCPCGSRTKFKHCCMTPGEATSLPILQGATAQVRIDAMRAARRFLEDWMMTPHDLFDGESPVEVMREPAGIEKVDAILNFHSQKPGGLLGAVERGE